MLLFGHLGITLAAGTLAKYGLAKKATLEIEPKETASSPEPSSPATHEEGRVKSNRISSLALLRNHFDYRFLLVGSLLPDILDKPVGGIIFYNTFQSGRIFGHTLCLNIILIVLGIYILKRWGKTWLAILASGSIVHVLLDRMWASPEAFFWPAYGWRFPKISPVDFFGWLLNVPDTLANPAVCIPEIIGLGVLVWFAARLIIKKQVRTFIRSGTTSIVF
jgi:inner membrane protein